MDLNHAMERLLRIGPTEAMRQDEIAAGARVVVPGEIEWLSANDWPSRIVVSIAGDHVRIIAIDAIKPGHGAFSRMITGICKAGLIPIIVEPMGNMAAILQRWGWSGKVTGIGWTCEETWRPPTGWAQARAALTAKREETR